MPIATTNPATGETLETFIAHDAGEIERRLAAAAHAARSWARAPLAERARMLTNAARLLEDEREEFGRMMTLEMGKPLTAAIQEAEKCALGCRHYADHAAQYLAPEPVNVEGERAYVAYQPLGVVLAVMPWNFPFWQVIRFAAPALAAGNVAVLKHASNVPRCALAVEDLFRRAGAPDGVFQTLLIESGAVEQVIADPRVAAVTLTGSEHAGASVAAAAGKHVKKTVLELGGSDPFIVLSSADVDLAAETAVAARTVNNGQSCIAAKRFIVVRAVSEPFIERFVHRMSELAVGDPVQPATQVGPLATEKIRAELHEQVRRSVARGARVLTGGAPRPGPGYYYEPTVLTDVPAGAPARDEELFGPVAAVFVVEDADEAIQLANESRYGLAASVWTRDAGEADRFARDLHCGSVFVNRMVASDPRFPFGGVKISGYGRELGAFGLREFVNVKTVRMSGVPDS